MNRTNRHGFTLVELLVTFGVIAVLIALLLSAVQAARQTAARIECQSRLRQLALALHAYHDARGCFPEGHRSFASAMPLSGWTLSVLPYLEQSALAAQAEADYRAQYFPLLPPHPGLSVVVKAFLCPADGRVVTPQRGQRSGMLAAFTSYLGVAGLDAVEARDGVLHQGSTTRLADITDGSSNTLLLGERPPSADFQLGWWYAGTGQQLTGSADLVLGVAEPNLLPVFSGDVCGPGRYPYGPAAGLNDPCGQFHFWSPHPGGASFAFADGAVRLLPYATAVMADLASRSGGETATW
jgi:prepilin-type N-terminal cleavage/methylation domain-containing protein/prepilin-type processing-associated H-X9-DG protein